MENSVGSLSLNPPVLSLPDTPTTTNLISVVMDKFQGAMSAKETTLNLQKETLQTIVDDMNLMSDKLDALKDTSNWDSASKPFDDPLLKELIGIEIKDPRVNTIGDDPNLFSYISNQIILDNPASSIKVLLDAYIHNDSDIRLLYSIGENNNTFTLFPGYGNINPDNQSSISLENNDGSPDLKMTKQDRFISNPTPSDFKDYTFTANLSNTFKQFRIKLIGTSKSQAFVPIIKNLRVIALA